MNHKQVLKESDHLAELSHPPTSGGTKKSRAEGRDEGQSREPCDLGLDSQWGHPWENRCSVNVAPELPVTVSV